MREIDYFEMDRVEIENCKSRAMHGMELEAQLRLMDLPEEQIQSLLKAFHKDWSEKSGIKFEYR